MPHTIIMPTGLRALKPNERSVPSTTKKAKTPIVIRMRFQSFIFSPLFFVR